MKTPELVASAGGTIPVVAGAFGAASASAVLHLRSASRASAHGLMLRVDQSRMQPHSACRRASETWVIGAGNDTDVLVGSREMPSPSRTRKMI